MAVLSEINIYVKRKRMYQALILMLLLFMARLYQLQLIYKDEYGKISEENSVRTIPREPVRGYMYDRNGKMVVDNRPTFAVTITPFEFDTRNIPFLSSILTLDSNYIKDRVQVGSAYSRFVPVKIKRDADFRMLSALEEYRDRLPGVRYQVETKRYYGKKVHASHILGYTKEISESQMKSFDESYTQGDVVGASGLESKYEGILRGQKGAELTTVNVHGQTVGSFDNGKHDVPPVEGNDLMLTMDIDLQALAESLMTDKRGAVVALDPDNGGILAMVSKPDYDLSLFSGVTPPQIWRALSSDASKPLFNRATLTRYPPGSTFKMVLAIAALERNVVTPSWRVSCAGAFRYGDKVFKDLHVHGSVDMIEAIQRSCNVYFYQLMLRTGLDNWSYYGKQFGFGELTGVDIYEENPGLLPTTEYLNKHYGPTGWTRGFLVSFGIGQGDLGVTPLQMACYAMALANKGSYHQPHAVQAVKDKITGRTEQIPHGLRTIEVSSGTWDIVREGMRRVVQEPGGTGSMARIKGIEVAGKTGTSQNPHGPDHAWFVGFAPFDHPRIAIAVMVENAGSGGTKAAPIAGMCMEQFLYGRLIRLDTRMEFKTVRTQDSTATRKVISQAAGGRSDQTIRN